MNLTGQQIKDTYEGVLNIGATGLTGSLQTITDGLGNPLPMQVSNTTVNFTGCVTGIVGTTGPQGPTGAQGPIGPTGPAATGGSSPLIYDAGLTTYYTCTASPSATCPNSNNVIIGDVNFFCSGPAAGRKNYVGIGSCITSLFDGGFDGRFGVSIGTCLFTNPNSINIGCYQQGNENINIGVANATANGGSNIGYGNSSNGGWTFGNGNISSFEAVTLGKYNYAEYLSIGIGLCAKAYNVCSVSMGSRAQNSASNTISIGNCAQSFTGATGTTVIGFNSVGATGIENAVVLGSNLTSEKSDTTHVNNLIAYGQAASKAYSLGVTGTNVSVNWDNSNVQTMTLLGSGTLTMSNPIDGGVYTLQITQGTGGGHTLIWSEVKWPGGAPPSLSITAGATDIITFIYGPTAYYGNANLNFS